jgi:hypothetical protein
MKHFYYLLGLVYIIYELAWVVSTRSRLESTRNFVKESEKFKGKKWDEYSKEFKSMIKSQLLLRSFLILWIFLGLFTYNWVGYLALIILSVFLSLLPLKRIDKLLGTDNISVGIHWTSSLIRLLLGVFFIINSYHLKIDLAELVKSMWH